MDLVKSVGWLALLSGLFLAGCSAGHFVKSADKEVYRAIEQKTPLVPNMDRRFTVEQTNQVSQGGRVLGGEPAVFMGPDGEAETNATVLGLEEALSYGVRQSRQYQNRKEQLYLSALRLTLIRHQFTPIFSVAGTVEYLEQMVEPTPLLSDELVEVQEPAGRGEARVDWLIRGVGRVTAAFTTDALRFFVGDHSVVWSSDLSATFVRPLLRNAGFKAEQELLIQGERNLLYDLRGFAQFRRDFAVSVATAYYGVLGSRDTVRNSYLNLESSRKNAERSRALAQEGRITQSDLGRLEQQVLSAESAWINALRNYKQNLDNLKLLLGMSLDTPIVLADEELEALRILDPDLTVEESIRIALESRLDYMTVKDQVADAERNVGLAKDFLKPQVDLGARAAIRSDPGESGEFTLPDPKRYTWSAGLEIDPALDRKAERNAYRQALIEKNRAEREVEQQEDEIKLSVRSSWRTLDQAKRNYEISQVGVDLAERRVEEQDLLAELGRAKAQDQVDAQNALIDSKNQLTLALVTHTIARLEFWNRLGILYIKDNGKWEEREHAQAK